jgi:hypothetical protein
MLAEREEIQRQQLEIQRQQLEIQRQQVEQLLEEMRAPGGNCGELVMKLLQLPISDAQYQEMIQLTKKTQPVMAAFLESNSPVMAALLGPRLPRMAALLGPRSEVIAALLGPRAPAGDLVPPVIKAKHTKKK